MDEIRNNELTSAKRWCILRHPDADLIGEIFSGKRKVYNASDDEKVPLPPFEHFIPFEDMKLRKPVEFTSAVDEEYKSYDAMLDARALRNDLHHFIFICEPKEVVSQILNAPWNKALRTRLYAYRNEKGEPIEISDTEMERFKTIIKRYDFQIVNGEPSEEVHEGDSVTIISGPMEGSDGKVMGIREKDGQVTLTVEFSMFRDKMCIAVPGISIADVRLKEQEAQQLLQDPVIGHFEDELIELLCHLHGKNGSKTLNKADRRRLHFLYQYSDIEFADNPTNRAKFAALMLICVYLLNDKDEIARRTKEVETLLSEGKEEPTENPSSDDQPSSKKNPSSDDQPSALSPQPSSKKNPSSDDQPSSSLACYLLMSLFIVKHDPALRKMIKTWRQTHPDCPLIIRRFLSIAKQIRC